MLLPPQNGRCGRQGAVGVLCGPRGALMFARFYFGRCCGRVVALGQDSFLADAFDQDDGLDPPVEFA